MIGNLVDKLLDARDKKLSEALEGWAAEKDITSMLRRENSELGKQLADLRGGDVPEHVRHLSNALIVARKAAVDQAQRYSEDVHRLQAERDAALAAKRVAESALSAFRIPPPAGGAAKQEADRHRTNALRLSDALSELRESTDKNTAEMEQELAELRARIKELETTPK